MPQPSELCSELYRRATCHCTGPCRGKHQRKWYGRYFRLMSRLLRRWMRCALHQISPQALFCDDSFAALRAQADRLPLHEAAANQASEEVVRLLLRAHPEAAKAIDSVRPLRAFACTRPSWALHARSDLILTGRPRPVHRWALRHCSWPWRGTQAWRWWRHCYRSIPRQRA